MHGKRSTLLLMLSLLITGCASPVLATAEVTQRSIEMDGAARHYLIQTPQPESQASRPLILLLHGHGGSGRQGWNDLRGVKTNPDTNDVGFLSALIDYAVANHGVDQTQVHIIGISNGGHMAFRMALEVPEQVAGIGAIAASMPANYQGRAPGKTINVAIMNGTRDRLMPCEGGPMAKGRGVVLSTEASFGYRAKANVLGPNPNSPIR